MARQSLAVDLRHATVVAWGKDQKLFRVHRDVYRPLQFNTSSTGDARFSPLITSSGVVPTLYAGTTLDCALIETVFHDIPFVPGLKTLSKKANLQGRQVSELLCRRHLRLIDLRSIALRKLGIARTQLIDTDATQYSRTRDYALGLYELLPSAEGMVWTSRQDDQSQAVILFEDRLENGAVEQIGDSRPLILPDGSTTSDVLTLATRLGVLIV